jgi:soluble lytic murein transglycosylase-like protein
MDIIADIESGRNPKAYNASSGAIGYCQILTCGALADYNNKFAIKIKPEDLFYKTINLTVADWYMNTRIPEMLDYFEIEDTIDNRLAAYNFGIGNVKNKKALPKETRNYIKKYHQKLEAKHDQE